MNNRAMGKRERYEQHKNGRRTVINRGSVQSYIVKTFGPAKREPGPGGMFVLEIEANGGGVILRNKTARAIYDDAITILGFKVL